MSCDKGERSCNTRLKRIQLRNIFECPPPHLVCGSVRQRTQIRGRASSHPLPVCACVCFIMNLLQYSFQPYLGLKDKERTKTYGVCWHMGAELWILSKTQELKGSDKENKQKKKAPECRHLLLLTLPFSPLLPLQLSCRKEPGGSRSTASFFVRTEDPAHQLSALMLVWCRPFSLKIGELFAKFSPVLGASCLPPIPCTP